MLRLIWICGVNTRYFLRQHMSTNVPYTIRTRGGLKRSVPGILLILRHLAAGNAIRILNASDRYRHPNHPLTRTPNR